ncbi:hypothetical protein MUG91_G22n231 [Manis pentadactyla]|nr:hypothetical protein MUG91_G22n231 [Manis pentadactyla]
MQEAWSWSDSGDITPKSDSMLSFEKNNKHSISLGHWNDATPFMEIAGGVYGLEPKSIRTQLCWEASDYWSTYSARHLFQENKSNKTANTSTGRSRQDPSSINNQNGPWGAKKFWCFHSKEENNQR